MNLLDLNTLAKQTETVPWIKVCRKPFSALSWRRLVVGGRISDAGRMPRYAAVLMLGASAVWAPIMGYLASAPVQFSSHASLILPGSGASASINLNDIGQASSFASSAFASNSVSPTETYKRLIVADRILDATAAHLGLSKDTLKRPRVTLVDQTSLIHIEAKASSREAAQRYGESLIKAFLNEVDHLRLDEQSTREDSGSGAIQDYIQSIRDTRGAITKLQQRSGLITAAQYHQQIATHDALKQEVSALEADLSRQAETVFALSTALNLPPHAASATLKLYADAPYLTLLDDVADHAANLAQASNFGRQHPSRIKAEEAYSAAQNAALARAGQVTGLAPKDLAGLDRAPEGQRAALLSELVRETALRDGLERKYATLSARVSAEDTRLTAMAPLAAELEDRQRDFAVAEAVFASAIARTESTKTDVYASYPLVQVLENPSRPEHPSSPNRKLAIAAGSAATFMLIIGLALAWLRKPLLSRLLDASAVGEAVIDPGQSSALPNAPSK